MDKDEFHNYLMKIRDSRFSRPQFSELAGFPVTTIKSYEKGGILPDIDYLAALAMHTGHPFSDLILKRVSIGTQHAAVELIRREFNLNRQKAETKTGQSEMLDKPLVGLAIQGVVEGLNDIGRKLPPAKLAELILIAYELLKDGGDLPDLKA